MRMGNLKDKKVKNHPNKLLLGLFSKIYLLPVKGENILTRFCHLEPKYFLCIGVKKIYVRFKNGFFTKKKKKKEEQTIF